MSNEPLDFVGLLSLLRPESTKHRREEDERHSSSRDDVETNDHTNLV